ncbi:MAG: hypothetical protein HQ568_10335 [Calditrichaeota bacterium]|nr:hypothetical protein [Calditrichota bacterium]
MNPSAVADGYSCAIPSGSDTVFYTGVTKLASFMFRSSKLEHSGISVVVAGLAL